MLTEIKKNILPVGAWLIAIFLVTPVFSQVVQTHRFETEQKGSDEYFSIIPMHEGKLALLRQRNKFSGNKRLWEIFTMDTALTETKHIEFHIEERYPMIGYEIDNENLFLLFRTGETSRNDLVLLNVDTRVGEVLDKYEIKPEVDLKITHFSKAGTSFVFGGYVSNDPAIFLYDPKAKSLKVIPGFFQKDTELVDLRVNQNQTFNVILIDRSTKSGKKLILRTFDETGKILLEDIVPLENEKYLQQSMTSALQREDMMIIGTWGEHQGKQSSGFYSIPVDPFNEQKIKYFHFGEMSHFVDYLSPKRGARIKNNTLKDIQAGKNPTFTAFVVPFKLFENEEGYFLLAEVYNPVSSTSPYYGSPYGNPYYANPYSMYNPYWPSFYYPGLRYRPYPQMNNNNQNTKNDQVKTFATVLMHFDAKGSLLWDESIKLDNVEKPALEQVADFYTTSENLIFLYKKKSELKIKTIALGSDAAVEEIQKVKLLYDDDDIRQENESEGGLKHWIGNSFYMWGYETIKNPTLKDNRLRDVFYINKIIVH
jgi:hypothetical protein